MGLPAKRRASSQKYRRRSHEALRLQGLVACGHCQRMILPHRVCPHCGFYRGRQVLQMTNVLDRKKQKERRREGAADKKETKERSR